MTTLLQEVQSAVAFLESRGVELPRKDAEELLSHLLGIQRLDIYLHPDQKLDELQMQEFQALLQRRAEREPLQYIIGSVEFYNSTLKVDRRALIPRPETEELVEKIVKEIGQQAGTFFDICCGTGCIAIAIKKACPQLNVYATDIDDQALSLAKENASLNKVDIHFFQGDLIQPLKEIRCDFLASNPPYIISSEINTLQPEVQTYEPRKALDGGKDGLDFYRQLSRDIPIVLKAGGKAWLEIGHGQGKDVITLFSNPPWKKCHLEKDRAGRERHIFLVNE